MSDAVLLTLAATCVVGLLAWVVPLPDPAPVGSIVPVPPLRARPVRVALLVALPIALSSAGVLAQVLTPTTRLVPFVVVLGVLAAVLGGGPATAAVLRLVQDALPASGAPAATVLRGGATIGVLERAAICVSVLVGWPEGIAVVLAVKGLGRYPELREPGTSERFIIGTFSSVLWALACAGVVVLARA